VAKKPSGQICAACPPLLEYDIVYMTLSEGRLPVLLRLILAVTAAAASLPLAPLALASQVTPSPAPPAANPKDVASTDAIIAALYDVISGPAGQKRDWDRFRSLFVSGARLVPTGLGQDRKPRIRTLSPDEYAAGGTRMEAAGFFEREIGRTAETFGNVTHVFSAYESKHAANDEKPFARGINSIQLFNDGARWWVVTIFWDSEREGNSIPAKYLGKPGGHGN
jgi:hypothetical protein